MKAERGKKPITAKYHEMIQQSNLCGWWMCRLNYQNLLPFLFFCPQTRLALLPDALSPINLLAHQTNFSCMF